MPDFDLQAAVNARDTASGKRLNDQCGVCSKSMYREPPFPGVASEWRHKSTQQPISWNPEKHLASRTSVVPHAHRFEVGKRKGFERCSIVGCEAEIPIDDKEARAEAVQARRKGTQGTKDALAKQSRARGVVAGHESQAEKRAIPF